MDLSTFIVNTLGVSNVDARFIGKALYYPPCNRLHKIDSETVPLTLLQHVAELELISPQIQAPCCGFGGFFSIKMPDISKEMRKESIAYIIHAQPDYLIRTDMSCLLNIASHLRRALPSIKVMHLAAVLISH